MNSLISSNSTDPGQSRSPSAEYTEIRVVFGIVLSALISAVGKLSSERLADWLEREVDRYMVRHQVPCRLWRGQLVHDPDWAFNPTLISLYRATLVFTATAARMVIGDTLTRQALTQCLNDLSPELRDIASQHAFLDLGR